jgi:serine/threonine protein kinase
MQLVMGHANCVMLFETFEEQSLFHMVMEKCQASLMDRLDKMSLASEEYISRLFREMLLGIAHVHGVNLVHRDVKPHNYLLGGEDGQTVKLTDFGMAHLMPAKGYLSSHCGTAPYMSPEVVSCSRYSFNTDVWSMGVTAYVLLYGDFPYLPTVMTSESMKERILIGEPAPTFRPALREAQLPSDSACSFVAKLMVRTPSDRCSAREALQLPFVCTEPLADGDATHDLTPTLQCAVKNTRAFPRSPALRPDPIVARSLDDLLHSLQQNNNLHFTEPSCDKDCEQSDQAQGNSASECRRSRSSMTYPLRKSRVSLASVSTRTSVGSLDLSTSDIAGDEFSDALGHDV